MLILDGMIAEKCPNGAPFLRLGDISTIFRGTSPRPVKKLSYTEKYNQYISALERELEARKKQYGFYKNLILQFPRGEL